MNYVEKSSLGNILIRKIKKDDLYSVAEIGVSSWKKAYRGIIDDEYLNNLSIEENYKKRLKDYIENYFIVAELNKEIVGFCRYKAGNGYKEKYPSVDCEITALYVKPKYVRYGIGKTMVDSIIYEFKEKGFSNMIIWCLKDNYPSRAFYEKMGGILSGEMIKKIGDKDYKEVCFIYNLNKLPINKKIKII